MRLVAALGGNALLRRGEAPEAATLARRSDTAAAVVAGLARRHEVVVTHGNGPQVGLLAEQAEHTPGLRPYPLDILDAEAEGMVGYLLEMGLANALGDREVATLLTRVVVDADDPAMASPSKPVGPVYDAATALRLARERHWSVAPDGPDWRRVVPSPEPREIRGLRVVQRLLAAGVVVICAGGGGIPVAVDRDGRESGVEAVVDKDLTASLLAAGIGADALLLLTDVPAVEAAWGTPAARPLRELTVPEARTLALAPGSMAPKVAAACRFVESTGGLAAIGRLDDADAVLGGGAGTRILPASPRPQLGARAPSPGSPGAGGGNSR